MGGKKPHTTVQYQIIVWDKKKEKMHTYDKHALTVTYKMKKLL